MGLFASVTERIKQALATDVSGSTTVVVPELHNFLSAARIGGRLRPKTLSALILQADNGKPRLLVDLANECRQKDGHLQSVLFTRESALNGLDWVIKPHIPIGSKKPRRRDKQIAKFVTEALEQVAGLKDLISHLNGATYFGYSVAEINWHKVRGKLVPRNFSRIAPRRFEFRLSDGQLVWQDQTMETGVDLQKTYPGKFLVHQPRVVGDVPMREGLMRPLLWLALFRSWDVADWLKLAELSWKPWRIGTYKVGASTESRKHVDAILRNLAATGIASHSENVKLLLQFPEGAGTAKDNHHVLAEFLGGEMSKCTLGQTLTTEAGSRGARSLGDVHNEVRKDLRQADATAVGETLMRDLVTWIVRMNFGDAAVPKFEFLTRDRVDLKEFSIAVKNMAEAGVDMPQEWAQEQAGIPAPEDGDRVIVPVKAQIDGMSPVFGVDLVKGPTVAKPPPPPPPNSEGEGESGDGEGTKAA